MNSPDLTFILHAKELSADNQKLSGSFLPETAEDVDKLNKLCTEQGEAYDIRFDNEVTLGKTVNFEFTPYTNFAYAGYADALRNHGLTNKGLADKLKSCIFHQWAVKHASDQLIAEKHIDGLEKLLDLMIQQGYLHHHSLIFFNQHPVSISLSSNKNTDLLCTYLRDLSENQIKSIHSLCEFFGTGEDSHHVEEKKRIFSTVLVSLFEGRAEYQLTDILGVLEKLATEVKGQYSLYLENFRYEKFVKKLEENNEKFISRINDTISKVLSQILALPIAATALSVLSKGDLTWVGYIALLIYCIICATALYIQWSILGNVKLEINHFEDSGKIPNTLKEQWKVSRKYLEKLLQWQSYLAVVMAVTITLCLIYVLWRFIPLVLPYLPSLQALKEIFNPH